MRRLPCLALAVAALAIPLAGCDGGGIKPGVPSVTEARTAPAGFEAMQRQDGEKMLQQGKARR